MKHLFYFSVSIFIAFFFMNPVHSYAFQTSDLQDAVVATIDGQPVLLSELYHQFNRNPVQAEGHNMGEQLKEFLPAYIFYRLKLKEGIEAGFNYDEEILSEYQLFAQEAAYSYWLENDVKEDIFNTFANRLKEERKAFHILVEIAPGAAPGDVSAAYDRAMEAREQLLYGADPEEINRIYSSVRNGVPIGGSLPWITAGRTVSEFEDGLYALEAGELSMPVRSQFGYHIIYLEEIRERSPERLVSHIFFQPADNDSVKQLAESAYLALSEGEAWANVTEEYSMDRATASRAGSVGWVGYGMQFPESFVDKVMQAEINEPFSKPIEMNYGIHIIRIDSVQTFENNTQFDDYIMTRLEQLQRLTPDRNDVYDYLKELGNLQIHQDIMEKILDGDESGFHELQPFVNETIVTFFGQDFYVHQFIHFIENSYEENRLNNNALEEFVIQIVRDSLIEITHQYHPDYKEAMADFLNGLIVFRVNEEFIWNPENMDRNDLKVFYNKHIERYEYGIQYTYYRFSTVIDTALDQAHHALTDGIKPSEIEHLFPDIQVLYTSTRNPHTTAFSVLERLNPGEISEIESSGSLRYFYYLEHTEKPRSMTFEEAFNRVASDYQPVREEAYLNELIDKHHVKLYPENIR